jgi:GntR family transcriptional regulator/MocR family aminotransferase
VTNTLLSVDRAADEPLYRQVRRALEHGIAVGSLDPEAPLPSSRWLARELGLSRNTINAAYQELQADGYIESRPRSGLFVNREMRPRTSSAPRPHPEPARYDWSARLRPRTDAGLPHIEKQPGWAELPYPFVAGQVDPGQFPAGPWLRALRAALSGPHAHASLRDGVADDDPLLVEMLCRYVLPSRGIEAGPDEVLLTLGSQHGLYLVAQALLAPGSVTAVEDPGYLDARHIFVRAGARVRPLPVDGSGVVPPDDLAGTDLLYLTPSHHHPTNVTLSVGRRRTLLRQVAAGDTIIVEDDYDSEFRYRGSPSPALKALDDTGRVVYLGTFSKFLAPGLRLGFLVADRALVAELRDLRRYMLRHPPGHTQRAMALFISSGDYRRTVRRHRLHLRRKWETIAASANADFGWPVAAPPGGVSLWVTGPPNLDAPALARTALRHGIALDRGDVLFCAADPPRNHFRLGFGAIPHAAIAPGIRLLSTLIPGALR